MVKIAILSEAHFAQTPSSMGWVISLSLDPLCCHHFGPKMESGQPMSSRIRTAGPVSVPLFVFLFLLSHGSGAGQTREQSPSNLIGFLTYHIDRQQVVAGSCGELMYPKLQDRAASQALGRLGSAALPYIEAAIDSIEKRGPDSEFHYNASWLLLAYAKIKGPAAFPRLREMCGDPNFSELSIGVDSSTALSLGLTSYVSRWSEAVDEGCGISDRRYPDPRYPMHNLILAWEKGDRAMLEGTIGPNGRAALDSLLKGKTWDAMRTRLWHAKNSDKVAVGYRFDIRGPWAEPFEMLEDQNSLVGVDYPENPQLDTVFKDRSGKDCGTYRVRFLTGNGSQPYLIDNSDIGGLLRVISTCAANE